MKKCNTKYHSTDNKGIDRYITGYEIRPNGSIINRVSRRDTDFTTYWIVNSNSGPWDYLSNARRYADEC